MLCKSGGITNKDIGAIRIQGDHTFIELGELCVKGFFKSVGPDGTIEGSKIIQLTEAPNIPPATKGRNNERPRRRTSDEGPKRKKSFKPNESKKSRPQADREKPERQEKSTFRPNKENQQKITKDVREGAVSTSKKKDGKSIGADTPKPVEKAKSKLRKGASDPSIPMRAPKVGKQNSKKNKARRAQALIKATGKDSSPPRRR
jgi:ATP-dependent RNA helicase DeaD